MENTRSYRWASDKDTLKISDRKTVWRAKFRHWREQRRQRRLDYLNNRLARKLELDETQSRELGKFLRQFEHFQRMYHEERENSINNILRALADENADLKPVGQGLDSSVERLHLQLDKLLEEFSGWIGTLDSGQRHHLNRRLAHKFGRRSPLI